MHTTALEKQQPLVSVPELNEDQISLHAILKWWGPRGERWSSGYTNGDKACAAGAMTELQVRRGRLEMMLEVAAYEMGFLKGDGCYAFFRCSDSGFENARKMVIRAIELAGHHP